MLKIKSKDNKLKLLENLEKNNSSFFNAFVWSFDDDVEKAIIKYINSNGGIVTMEELNYNLCFLNGICDRKRLTHRLDSLISHQYLYKVAKKVTHTIYSKDIICYVLRLD